MLAEREVAKYLLATLFFWLGTGGVVPFLTRFGVNELGTDEPTAFVLVMVPLLTTIAFAAPAGWLGDRFGKKRTLMPGLILMGGSVMVGSQVQTVPQATNLSDVFLRTASVKSNAPVEWTLCWNGAVVTPVSIVRPDPLGGRIT